MDNNKENRNLANYQRKAPIFSKTINKLFNNIHECCETLVDLEIISSESKCDTCGNVSKLVITTEKKSQRPVYRCGNYKCSLKVPLLKGCKIMLPTYCDLIFMILCRYSYFQIRIRLGVSSSTIAAIKKKLIKVYREKNRRRILIGGPQRVVQVDESVLCRRGTIRDPTSSDDNVLDTVWILGIVDALDSTNLYVTKVENGTIECLTRALEGRIGVCSVLYSDGYPSYPGVARNLCLAHKVVNHSLGFISPDGTHTNNIENVWSRMKSEMVKEHGVKRSEIDDWLEVFMFRQYFLNEHDMDGFYDAYIDILRILLN